MARAERSPPKLLRVPSERALGRSASSGFFKLSDTKPVVIAAGATRHHSSPVLEAQRVLLASQTKLKSYASKLKDVIDARDKLDIKLKNASTVKMDDVPEFIASLKISINDQVGKIKEINAFLKTIDPHISVLEKAFDEKSNKSLSPKLKRIQEISNGVRSFKAIVDDYRIWIQGASHELVSQLGALEKYILPNANIPISLVKSDTAIQVLKSLHRGTNLFLQRVANAV